MTILIIASYFPPQNSIASLRPYSWAKWWSREGHKVTVLTTTCPKRDSDLTLDCSGFEIISLPIPILHNTSSFYHESIVYDKKNIKKLLLIFIKNIYTSFSQKTGCFNACRYPDFHDLWAKKVIKKINRFSFDLVISTGWPYSVHRVGLAMKERYPLIKWIVDWRDLWTKNHLYKGLKIFWPYENYLENKFNNNADLVTTVSEPLADILRRKTKSPVEVIYNGFDPDDFIMIKDKKRKKNRSFSIVYTGTIYKDFQDPSPLFKAVSNLKNKYYLTNDSLKIIFAGSNANVSDIADQFNVSEFYSYLGFLPRIEALQLQYDADLVLFLEFNNSTIPGILSGKIFEYLYIAREIMAIGINENTAAGKLINDTKSGFCFGTDVDKIEKYLLNKILYNNNYILEKNKNLIFEFERKKQAMNILNIFKNEKKIKKGIYLTSENLYSENAMTSGIIKKIFNQIYSINNSGKLFCKPIILTRPKYNPVLLFFSYLLFDIYKEIKINYNCDFIYIRRISPINYSFIKLLKKIKNENKDCKILYEIPTYPYDKEHKTLRSKINLFIEKMFRYKLKKYIDKVVSFNNYIQIFGIPTIKIKNGVNCDNIEVRSIDNNSQHINFIAVAQFNIWHGYDRIIEGIYRYYNENNKKEKIYLHFVGDGPELNRYKYLVKKFNIDEYIIFHGALFGKELTNVFNNIDIAIGSLGCHRIGIYLSSQLKSREYFARGLPVVSSTKIDIVPSDFEYCLYVPENDSPIEINNIIDYYKNILKYKTNIEITKEIRTFAEKTCDIIRTMQPIINYFSE
ncbi:MAG: glycosyltransferase [Methanobrevibacter sp.]|nr:glycosyltransferase [Methanobrevibacter sp.]